LGYKIIPKEEAENERNKVGEGQDEPNFDPYLERPEIGRGLADFFKGSWNFGLWWALIKKILYSIAGGVIGILLIIILFVKPGLLMG